jgi:hypothetical protein
LKLINKLYDTTTEAAKVMAEDARGGTGKCHGTLGTRHRRTRRHGFETEYGFCGEYR